METIALEQARAGAAAAAMKWARKSLAKEDLARLIGRMAAVQARAGNAAEAEENYQLAEKEMRRTKGEKRQWLFAELRDAYASGGRYAQAMRIGQEAYTENPRSSLEPAEAVSEVARKAGDFVDALQLARMIRLAGPKVEALQTIAKAQIEKGDRDGATGKLVEAWEIARDWREYPSGVSCQIEIIEALSPLNRDADLGTMLAKAFENATFAKTHPPKPYGGEQWLEEWDSLQSQIARMQAKRGAFEVALTEAEEIQKPFNQQHVFSAVTSERAKKGLIPDAMKTMALVTHENLRGSCIRDVVQALLTHNAVTEVGECIRSLNPRDPREGLYWDICFTAFLQHLVERGELEKAKAEVAALKDVNPRTSAHSLMNIAAALHNRGRGPEAAAALEEAAQMAARVDDGRDGLHFAVVKAAEDFGTGKAVERYEELFGIKGADPWVLGRRAARFIERGEIAKARELYEAAEEPMEKVAILIRSAEALPRLP